MAGEAAAALVAIAALKLLLSNFESSLKFGSLLCPIDTPIETITSIGSFNVIIVGGGTAGAVLANRLSKCPSVSVLLIEAGGCPPLESNFPGYITLIPETKYDYNLASINNNYTFQNLKGGVAGLTIGKMLGGSSGLNHFIFVRGAIRDYDHWVQAANDSSWSYEELLPYFIRSENVKDKEIIKEYGAYHGTCGPTKVRRQLSAENAGIFDAFAELGYKILSDINNNNVLGVNEPLFQEDDKFRQSSLVSYIAPVKNRKNLFVITGARATKIIINDKKVAIGVQFTYNGSSYIVKCKDEIIISTGALLTPQLLMLSGIGPSDHLKNKNIPVIADLPVGKNLQDHVAALMLFGLEEETSPVPALNPFEVPAAVTCNYANVDNSSADFAQLQGINLVLSNNNPGLMQFCLNVYKYTTSICQKWYDANIDRKVWLVDLNLLHPYSRGEILLNTTNINDQPLINLGYFSNRTDLVNLARFAAYTANILNTTYFKKIGAEFFDLDLCSEYEKYSVEFWECYVLEISAVGLWHFCGTASMGSVVDAQLQVKGVLKLRVVDASVIPVIPGGNINAAVLALAEKAADIIRDKYKYCCC